MNRAQYVDLVEREYFGNVTSGDVDACRRCFTSQAVIDILHGDLPRRQFKAAPGAGEVHLSEFWKHLCANFLGTFSHFSHVIDTDAHCCASTFTVALAPKPASPYFARGVLTLYNCNFFWLENDRIARMMVYYANPDTGGSAPNKPTGYPPRSVT